MSTNALILDLDGVVFRDGVPITGSLEAIDLILKNGYQVALCTNNLQYKRGKLRKIIADSLLCQLQIFDPIDRLVSMLDDRQIELPDRILVIGELLKECLLNLGCIIADTHHPDAVFVGSTMALDFETFSRAVRAVISGSTLIGVGGERLFTHRGVVWPSSGTLVAAIEFASRSKALILGKPSVGMFHFVAHNFCGHPSIMVVGDDFETDIEGASAAGFSSAFVAPGITPGHNAQKQGYLLMSNLAELAYSLVRDNLRD